MAIGNRWRGVVERAWWSPGLTPWQLLAAPLAGLYRVLWWLRSQAYRLGVFKTAQAPVPVIVVGNLIVGGAGKTPCVIALVRALQAQGWRPGVLSRGHLSSGTDARPVQSSSTAHEVGDEPLLMWRRTGVPVWVGRDRAAAAHALCRAHPDINILVADDGLQHLGLHRDAQLVVFDERGAGNGSVLPAGPLREPLWRRTPPATLVLYNADRPTTPLPGHMLERRLGKLLPLKSWWANDDAATIRPEALSKTPLLAAAGIGHPSRFFALLRNSGLTCECLALPDHANLDPRPWPAHTPLVIVTEKDAVKLRPDAPDADRIIVATLDLVLPVAALDSLRQMLPDSPQPR